MSSLWFWGCAIYCLPRASPRYIAGVDSNPHLVWIVDLYARRIKRWASALGFVVINRGALANGSAERGWICATRQIFSPRPPAARTGSPTEVGGTTADTRGRAISRPRRGTVLHWLRLGGISGGIFIWKAPLRPVLWERPPPPSAFSRAPRLPPQPALAVSRLERLAAPAYLRPSSLPVASTRIAAD